MVVLKLGQAPQPKQLPNLRSKPSFASLYAALECLALQPDSWTGTPKSQDPEGLDPKFVNQYLLSIVSSELTWFQDGSEDVMVLDRRDKIWELASKRMAERCGRTAMPEMTRTWLIPAPITGSSLAFTIREPPLTGDNLGFKTWGTAFTMAQKLDDLRTKHLSHLFNEQTPSIRALELGSGTGLVGIAAAALWSIPVLLTDLPEIQVNLSYNVLQNTQLVEAQGGRIISTVLDWNDPSAFPIHDFEIIMAADPMYDDAHPELVAHMIETFLKRNEDARALIAVPLRDQKTKQMTATFQEVMTGKGFSLLAQGQEICRDDWKENDVEETGAGCWWAIWSWAR
ncbi:hypothetical protein OIDMADRAFT_147564 [Oidiodendron maius Zn]|uniref:FAM86 N-terminal domain-containing protein n=1 Tax=Oidiodendron maius (strain Zn) TaxID=913774 RepID=A0A0C3H6J2_OIDMZ|nr:hypothetical protein OIDMADRAFT_147564 [Oidiodendron maius Zn]